MKNKKNFIGVWFGGFTLKVYNVREVYGHDDSWPFNAEFEVLRLGGEPFLKGNAWNDGWGGPTQLGFTWNEENRLKYEEVNAECKFFDYHDDFFHLDMKHSFAEIVEIMAGLYGGKNNGKIFSYTSVVNYLKSN